MQQYTQAVVTLYVMGMVAVLVVGALYKLFTSISLF